MGKHQTFRKRSMVKKYIPEQGDIVWISLDPQAGHEQKGRRPALVVSHREFNEATKMAMLCPITSTNRNFPFHVEYTGNSIQGFIMTEQVKSLDIFSREISFIDKIDKKAIDEVIHLLKVIIF